MYIKMDGLNDHEFLNHKKLFLVIIQIIAKLHQFVFVSGSYDI